MLVAVPEEPSAPLKKVVPPILVAVHCANADAVAMENNKSAANFLSMM
jgi:hypothetical protein